jgi:hypothetical protein
MSEIPAFNFPQVPDNDLDRKTLESAAEIGRRLVRVCGPFDYLDFIFWIECEFGVSGRSARRLIELAEMIDPKLFPTVEDFGLALSRKRDGEPSLDFVRLEIIDLVATTARAGAAREPVR